MNSNGLFRNNLQSKIIDKEQLGYALQGLSIENDFYYLIGNFREDQRKSEGTNLLKNSMLVAKANSSTWGRMIDAEKQDCHLCPYIYTYNTLMYCIHKSGTIVRLDKRTKETSDNKIKGQNIEIDIAFLVNNDVVDFSRYWSVSGLKDNITSISFIFDEKGNISSLVVNAFDNKGIIANIYLVTYLGGGNIGRPELLVSDANLFGVAKKN